MKLRIDQHNYWKRMYHSFMKKVTLKFVKNTMKVLLLTHFSVTFFIKDWYIFSNGCVDQCTMSIYKNFNL